MNLLISEMSMADAMLDRAIPWTESMFDSPGSLALDDESHEHPGRVVSSAAPPGTTCASRYCGRRSSTPSEDRRPPRRRRARPDRLQLRAASRIIGLRSQPI
jgi:hypothetical protein